jgi:hypothetical protein
MTVTTLAPPPLPDELDRSLRRLRLPYVRRAAPEVLATAASQRWEHAEVLRVLLARRPPAVIRRRPRRAGMLRRHRAVDSVILSRPAPSVGYGM